MIIEQLRLMPGKVGRIDSHPLLCGQHPKYPPTIVASRRVIGPQSKSRLKRRQNDESVKAFPNLLPERISKPERRLRS